MWGGYNLQWSWLIDHVFSTSCSRHVSFNWSSTSRSSAKGHNVITRRYVFDKPELQRIFNGSWKYTLVIYCNAASYVLSCLISMQCFASLILVRPSCSRFWPFPLPLCMLLSLFHSTHQFTWSLRYSPVHLPNGSLTCNISLTRSIEDLAFVSFGRLECGGLHANIAKQQLTLSCCAEPMTLSH